MNRLLTSVIQLALLVPALYCLRYLIAGVREMWHESQQDNGVSPWQRRHLPLAFVGGYPQVTVGYPQPLEFCEKSHKHHDTPMMD